MRIAAVGAEFGFNPIKTVNGVRQLPHFLKQYRKHAREFGVEDDVIIRPALLDAMASNGSTNGHYFHQDLHVARRVFEDDPATHFDVGSRIDGFIAHVASFRRVHVLDVRPSAIDIPNVTFHTSDICNDLPVELRESADSVSCLHALEHFGLGRYGDPIDSSAYLRGFENLSAILTPGGRMYLSVPISERPRIEFNAHRIFALPKLLDLFTPNFNVVAVSYIGDDGRFHTDIDAESDEACASFGTNYGCAIVEAIKK